MAKFQHPRLKNWPILLANFLADAQRNSQELKLDWVNNVCAGWVGQSIETITGVNPYIEEFGSINSANSAALAIQAAGYTDLEELMYDRFYEVPLSMAQRGDICILEAAPIVRFSLEVMPVAVGVIEPPYFWCVGADGLCKGDLSSALAAFMIDQSRPGIV